MSARTLDEWADRVPIVAQLALDSELYSSGPGLILAVRVVGRVAGPAGFTADDVREFFSAGGQPPPVNPGSAIGSLCSRGELVPIGDEPTRTRTSKGRRVRRFVLSDDPPAEGGGET